MTVIVARVKPAPNYAPFFDRSVSDIARALQDVVHGDALTPSPSWTEQRITRGEKALSGILKQTEIRDVDGHDADTVAVTPLLISVSESVTVVDSATVETTLSSISFSVSESVAVSESVTVVLSPLLVVESETIAVVDDLTVVMDEHIIAAAPRRIWVPAQDRITEVVAQDRTIEVPAHTISSTAAD